jgi:hypothetical protein
LTLFGREIEEGFQKRERERERERKRKNDTCGFVSHKFELPSTNFSREGGVVVLLERRIRPYICISFENLNFEKMSAKFLHVFVDENPDLSQQIGCMTGIFQMFDRQYLLTNGRRLPAPKQLPSGTPFNFSTLVSCLWPPRSLSWEITPLFQLHLDLFSW